MHRHTDPFFCLYSLLVKGGSGSKISLKRVKYGQSLYSTERTCVLNGQSRISHYQMPCSGLKRKYTSKSEIRLTIKRVASYSCGFIISKLNLRLSPTVFFHHCYIILYSCASVFGTKNIISSYRSDLQTKGMCDLNFFLI